MQVRLRRAGARASTQQEVPVGSCLRPPPGIRPPLRPGGSGPWTSKRYLVPGETECVYGRWFGRTARDIPPIALGASGGAAVVTYALAASSGVLGLPNLPVWANVLLVQYHREREAERAQKARRSPAAVSYPPGGEAWTE
jgi:hypothetical protein